MEGMWPHLLDFCKNHSPKDNPFLTHSVTFQKTNISQQAAIVKFSKPTKRKELAFSSPGMVCFTMMCHVFHDDLPCFSVSPPTSKGLQPSGFFSRLVFHQGFNIFPANFPMYLRAWSCKYTGKMVGMCISPFLFSPVRWWTYSFKGNGFQRELVQSPQDAKSFWSRLFGVVVCCECKHVE